MSRQIDAAKAAAASASQANSAATYPSVTDWAACQDKARPNLLDRDAELNRSKPKSDDSNK